MAGGVLHSLRRHVWSWLAFLVLCGVLAWLCDAVWSQLAPRWNWERLQRESPMLISGWKETLWMSLAAMAGSAGIGFLFMCGQRSGLMPLRLLCQGLLELVRCSPLFVLLLAGYFLVCAPLFSRGLDDAGYDEKFVIGCGLLSLFGGAYLGEVFRGAVDSIAATQWDAARAAGFSQRQVWQYVILPQAFRRVLPALAGQFVSLIKDSSLLSVIGVQEFAYRSQGYQSKTYGGLEAYVPLAIGYLVLTIPVALLARWLESRMKFRT